MPRFPLVCTLFGAGLALAQPGPGSSIAEPRPGAPRLDVPRVPGDELGATDLNFMRDATQSGLAQIAAGRLALERSRNQRIRDYAEQVVRVHRQANARLAEIARAKRIPLPARPSPDKESALLELRRLPTSEFDERFLRQMVDDHQAAVDQYGHEIKGRHQARALKEFAQQTIVKLEDLLGVARRLRTHRAAAMPDAPQPS